MDIINVYSDGACTGNPGKGGWGTVLEFGKKSIELSGAFKHTTNNRMELIGAIEGIKTAIAHKAKSIILTTDSQYIANAFSKGWLASWKRNSWRKADKSPVLNLDLWKIIDQLTSQVKFKVNWVKGHAGHRQNERCDELATTAIANGPWKDDKEYATNFTFTLDKIKTSKAEKIVKIEKATKVEKVPEQATSNELFEVDYKIEVKKLKSGYKILLGDKKFELNEVQLNKLEQEIAKAKK